MATDMMKTVWPEWQLEEKPLGRGSYGVVYKAVRKDHNVESYAAIKVVSIPSHSAEVDSLRSEGLDENATKAYFQGMVDDFVGEIQMMESLKGTQNIVSVEDYKVVPKSDGVGWDIYIRMELLTTFNAYISDKKMTEQEVIKLGCDICSALEICDKRNIIHRDIKPENIFINDFGHFKLGDFGIARKLENATGGLSQKGTYNYMAPEVANSGEYDARVDTYSLGIVLYRLLNGNKVPFLETEAQQMSPAERKKAVDRRLRGEPLPAPSEATPEMANLILKACAFRPEDRFSSAAEMHQALKQLEAGVYMADDLDKTTAVRGVQNEMDATTAVRKADDKNQKQETAVGSFGKKKFNKAKFIAIAVASGILALAIALTVLFFSSSAYSVSRYMKKDDYQRALKEYRRDVRGSFVQETLLKTLLKGNVDEVVADYDKGKISFAEAVDELTTLDDMKIKNADAKSKELATKYADKVKAAVSAGEMTDEEAMTELNLLEELGFEGVDTHRAEVRTAYADCISAKYYNGELEYGEVVDKLAALISKDCKEAEASRQQIMIDYAQNIVSRYENGELPYSTAAALLTEVKNDGCQEAKTLLDQITADHDTDDAMKKADDYHTQGEYVLAMNEYEKIPASSEKYEEAQTKLQQVYTDYIDATVAQAQQYREAKDYVQAIESIDEACAELPDTVDTAALATLKEECVLEYKTEKLTAAEALAAGGDYRGAIDALERTMITVRDDAELEAKVTQYSQEHVSKTVASANALAAQEKFAQALELLNEIKVYYPNHEDLNKAITDITAAQEAKTDTAKNPNQNPVQPKTPEEHNTTGGSSKANAVKLVREDIYHSSFTTDGEVDWYKFTTSENYSAYSIEILNNSVNTTIYVTLYDGYDKQLNRVELGKGETAWLDYGLTAKTEYWIKVDRYYDTRMGNYQLAVNEEICDAGMSQANAFYVDLGDNYTKELDVNDINDWYKFVTTDNYATYQFALTNNSINTSVYLTVFDEYNTELGQIEIGKGESRILDLNLKKNREYTVRISRYYGTREGYYQISVSEMICDSGLTRAEAVPLNLNQSFYGKADTGFSEWYCFTFTKDGTYTLKLTNNSINTTLYATVYDALGTELGSVSAGQTETNERSLTIAAGTVLYVKISRYYSDRFGNYTILVS